MSGAPWHDFAVSGSPASVNAAGSAPYRAWRQRVYDESVLTHQPGGSPKISTGCTVWVRYFRRLDCIKDVDNILKAILDGMNGRGNVSRYIAPSRILSDDRIVERVISARTDLLFHTKLDGSAMAPIEFAALLRAQHDQAAVAVRVEGPPSHLGTLI